MFWDQSGKLLCWKMQIRSTAVKRQAVITNRQLSWHNTQRRLKFYSSNLTTVRKRLFRNVKETNQAQPNVKVQMKSALIDSRLGEGLFLFPESRRLISLLRRKSFKERSCWPRISQWSGWCGRKQWISIGIVEVSFILKAHSLKSISRSMLFLLCP